MLKMIPSRTLTSKGETARVRLLILFPMPIFSTLASIVRNYRFLCIIWRMETALFSRISIFYSLRETYWKCETGPFWILENLKFCSSRVTEWSSRLLFLSIKSYFFVFVELGTKIEREIWNILTSIVSEGIERELFSRLEGPTITSKLSFGFLCVYMTIHVGSYLMLSISFFLNIFFLPLWLLFLPTALPCMD